MADARKKESGTHEKKHIICAAIVFLVLFACAFAAGVWTGSAYRKSGTGYTAGTGWHEGRVESAQNAVDSVAGGLAGVAEQVQYARTEVDQGISGIGELGTLGSRIAGTGGVIEESAGRIEDRIQRIESILSEAERKDIVLAGCSSYIDSGGGD